jgi:hypothetical protein
MIKEYRRNMSQKNPDHPSRFNRDLIDKLKSICGEENILLAREDLFSYGYDATQIEGNPDLVVFPGSAQERDEDLPGTPPPFFRS